MSAAVRDVAGRARRSRAGLPGGRLRPGGARGVGRRDARGVVGISEPHTADPDAPRAAPGSGRPALGAPRRLGGELFLDAGQEGSGTGHVIELVHVAEAAVLLAVAESPAWPGSRTSRSRGARRTKLRRGSACPRNGLGLGSGSSSGSGSLARRLIDRRLDLAFGRLHHPCRRCDLRLGLTGRTLGLRRAALGRRGALVRLVELTPGSSELALDRRALPGRFSSRACRARRASARASLGLAVRLSVPARPPPPGLLGTGPWSVPLGFDSLGSRDAIRGSRARSSISFRRRSGAWRWGLLWRRPCLLYACGARPTIRLTAATDSRRAPIGLANALAQLRAGMARSAAPGRAASSRRRWRSGLECLRIGDLIGLENTPPRDRRPAPEQRAALSASVARCSPHPAWPRGPNGRAAPSRFALSRSSSSALISSIARCSAASSALRRTLVGVSSSGVLV